MAGFGQVIVGPPGSGKTTYCHALKTFCDAINRPAAIINLDPANDRLPYECAVDIAELITIDAVMEEFQLGPNGGLIYCMEFLVKNREWLLNRLAQLKGKYLIFDLPGQVELYTHHQGMHELVQSIQEWGYRELPHLNVLSKIDLIEQFGETDFNLDFYTDVLDLECLLGRLSKDPWGNRFRNLNQELCGLVESHALVAFTTLSVTDKQSMASLLKRADKANGYVFDQLYGVMRPGAGGAPQQPSPAAAIRQDQESMRQRQKNPFAGGAGAIDPVEELGTFRNLAVQQRYMGSHHHHAHRHHEEDAEAVILDDGHDRYHRDIVDSVVPGDEEAESADLARGSLAQFGAHGSGEEQPSRSPVERPSMPWTQEKEASAASSASSPGGESSRVLAAAASSSLLPVIDCATCGFPIVRGKKLRCARCQVAYYCDAGCQKKHWPVHRKSCVPAK